MDEVVFRTSQKVDNLQYQLKQAANEGKNAVVHFSEKVKDAAIHVLKNPKYSHALEAIQTFLEFIFRLSHQCKDYIVTYYEPKIFLRRMLKILRRNVSKRDVLIGSACLVVGAVVGFCISYGLPRQQVILRCMQAIQCLRYSGVEAVILVEDAIGPKECRKNEILVSVKAASVNVIDIEICKGYGSLVRSITTKFYKHCQGELPVTLGRDCTGIVVDIGENVSHLEVGDEVWLTSPFWAPGTMAEYIVVSENKVSHKPKTIGFEAAASLPYCGSIALSVLGKIDITPQNAKLKNVFVHGGCSAIGCILIQILTAWGAKITTTCYKRAVPVAKALGVVDVIGLSPLLPMKSDSDNDNVILLKKELCYREKFDAIITTTICELNNRELHEFCKSNGKVISTLPQILRSDSSNFFLRTMYSIRFRISSYVQKIFTGTLNSFGEVQMCYHMLDELRTLVESGKIQTVVDRVLQPHDIEQALNHIQSVNSIGSTVITFR